MSCRRLWKKGWALAFAALLLFCAWAPVTRTAAQDSYAYQDNGDGTVTVTGYSGSDMQLTIPDTLDGKQVTGIGSKAFHTKDITSVVIPASVTTIGEAAFQYCVKLQSLSFTGDGLTQIDKEAFSYCTALTSVILPTTVQSVGAKAFSNMGTIAYGTQALSISYGSNVFSGTKLSTLTCRQSSTTYAYAVELAKKVNYSGPYLDALSVTLNVADKSTLTLNNAQGDTVWTSSKPEVATVENGVLTGCKAGKTVISVQNSGETLKVNVTVRNLKLNYSKVTVTKGYTKKISVKNLSTAAIQSGSAVVWSSSNPKVAAISKTTKSNGGASVTIKAKKTGKTTISAKVASAVYKCKVTVKDNSRTIQKYSTNAYSYGNGTLGFASISKTSKGYRVKGHFINGTSNRIQGIKHMTVTVKADGKVIARKYIGNLKLNLGARKTRALTYSFTGSQVKKKVDLRAAKKVTVSVSGATFFWEETKTITKTVPANQ